MPCKATERLRGNVTIAPPAFIELTSFIHATAAPPRAVDARIRRAPAW
jgi:hypothetical protein